MSDQLLAVRNLRTDFPIRGAFGRTTGRVHAVDDVTLEIRAGETLGLVGESGCGKSTLGRALLGLAPITSGEISFQDDLVASADTRFSRRLRREMQIVFQDPAGSLDPHMSVEQIVREGLDIHAVGDRSDRRHAVYEMLDRVGLPHDLARRYPHELSGGQQQRVGIARALTLTPSFLVLDEPVSALDVSTQSQVLNLLIELKRSLRLTYLFIAHDLAVVSYVSDRIAVMYLGKIVEVAPAQTFHDAPLHPYSAALASAVLTPSRKRADRPMVLSGEVPSPIAPPSGCHFRTRCPIAKQVCVEAEPPLLAKDPDHLVACHFAGVSTGNPHPSAPGAVPSAASPGD